MCHRQEIPTSCSEISREQLTSARSTDINPARVAATRARRRSFALATLCCTRVHHPWHSDLHSVRYASKRSNAVASRTHAQCQLMSQLLMNLPTMTRAHRQWIVRSFPSQTDQSIPRERCYSFNSTIDVHSDYRGFV